VQWTSAFSSLSLPTAALARNKAPPPPRTMRSSLDVSGRPRLSQTACSLEFRPPLVRPIRRGTEVALETKAPLRTSAPVRAEKNLDLADALVLVSCVKSKRARPAPARSLYISAWFCKARDLVEVSGARWFVLSALYGLVPPTAEIAPYDHTLNTLGVADRRAWASRVLDQLLPEIVGVKRVVMFAGHRYREFLVEPLERRGIKVEAPMAHLARGEQLRWLSEH
jgi:hypothetical protein